MTGGSMVTGTRAAAARGCKGCGPQYAAAEEQIDRLLAHSLFRSEAAVPDDVYEARLAACGGCAKLQGGNTCAVCGCFVRVRARLKQNGCPDAGAARWQAMKDI